MAIIKIIGHAISVIILMTSAFVIRCVDWMTRGMVLGVERMTGATIERDRKKLHGQREFNNPVYEKLEYIDEKAMLRSKPFAIPPDDLINRCKKLIEAEFGSKNPDLLSDDFQFVFPVVGPLEKTEFCTIFGSFKLKDAFPDSKGNYFGFLVDPLEPNRVWFFSRAKMTHTGKLKFGTREFPATKKEVINTPQVLSMSFDLEGRCYKFTGGYSIDRTIGNCGGLGGVFGIIHALGGVLPFPEGRPWKPSLEWEALSKRVPEITKEWGKMIGSFKTK